MFERVEMIDKIRDMFFVTCKRTRTIKGVKFNANWYSFILLPVIGFLATVWVLYRVVTKPSRLSYPCVKAALPISSSFLIVVGGMLTSMFSAKQIKTLLSNKKVNYPLVSLFVVVFFVGIFMYVSGSSKPSYADYATSKVTANEPMGTPQGINPGRVVWVHDADATNENCTNTFNGDGVGNDLDDGWFLNKNNDQDAIDEMLSNALQTLTGASTDQEAWELLFKYNNAARGKGDVGYQTGEKIFIKINATGTWGFGEFWGNISSNFQPMENSYYALSETSPQLIMALLRQLVNVVGVAQEDIAIGDPMKHVYKHSYDLWTSEFPNIVVTDYDHATHGRTKVVVSNEDTLYYSDRGTILDAPFDRYYTVFHNCEYMFNIPELKGHKRAGCTMFAKNHFGSHTRSSAEHLHKGLVNPDETAGTGDERNSYGLYRVQVDLMSWEKFREKYVVYLMGALWAAGDELGRPDKWQMAPFNNDYMSSIFLSQDPVAIECVGYDFLHTEFTADKHPGKTFVQQEGVDDYLRQAASSENWPEGFMYDPENDGTPIPSLGVYEHWNNADEKAYSGNLGTGNGIELIPVDITTGVASEEPAVAQDYALQAYPNPFNPAVNIQYTLAKPGNVSISVYNVRGEQVIKMGEKYQQAGAHTENISFSQYQLASGNYMIRLQSADQSLVRMVSYVR